MYRDNRDITITAESPTAIEFIEQELSELRSVYPFWLDDCALSILSIPTELAYGLAEGILSGELVPDVVGEFSVYVTPFHDVSPARIAELTPA